MYLLALSLSLSLLVTTTFANPVPQIFPVFPNCPLTPKIDVCEFIGGTLSCQNSSPPSVLLSGVMRQASIASRSLPWSHNSPPVLEQHTDTNIPIPLGTNGPDPNNPGYCNLIPQVECKCGDLKSPAGYCLTMTCTDNGSWVSTSTLSSRFLADKKLCSSVI